MVYSKFSLDTVIAPQKITYICLVKSSQFNIYAKLSWTYITLPDKKFQNNDTFIFDTQLVIYMVSITVYLRA